MEKKAWHYKDGKKQELQYTPSGKISKLGEFMRKYPKGIIEIHNMRAAMR